MQISLSRFQWVKALAEKAGDAFQKWRVRTRAWLQVEFSQARLAYIRAQAEKGDAANQFRFGTIYERGEFGLRSDAEAYKWFLRAAFQGIPEAQARVSDFHSEGRGAPKNDEEAFIWCRKAAEQGYVPSQARLAEMYRDGIGVARNPMEAKKWHVRVARQNSPVPEFTNGQLSAC